MESAINDVYPAEAIGHTSPAPLTTAAEPVTRDDDATGALLQSILDLVAECDEQPTFCGFQVIEQRNATTGELLAVRLVAHDKLGDIVSPRVL